MHISIIIPAYASANHIQTTHKTTVTSLEKLGKDFEIIYVNDHSPDNVWREIQKICETDVRAVGISLAKNYGQHAAIFVGLQNAKGQYTVTIDDDLQNPPSEIAKLISKLDEGYDLAVGFFQEKKHAPYRKVGSKFIHLLVAKIFGSNTDFKNTNFRAFTLDVKNRILQYNGHFPYITGLAILNAARPINVEVKHAKRVDGASTYSLWRLLKLATRIMFCYSDMLIRWLAVIGILTSVVSLAVGMYALVHGLVNEGTMPGWASIIVFVAFSNSVIFLILTAMASFLSQVNSMIALPSPFVVSARTSYGDKS